MHPSAGYIRIRLTQSKNNLLPCRQHKAIELLTFYYIILYFLKEKLYFFDGNYQKVCVN